MTQNWLTEAELVEITELYSHSTIAVHVDHIVPLRGAAVCGLHVPWNLQLLDARENVQKGNTIVSDS